MIIHKGNLSAPMGYRNNIPIWDGKKEFIDPVTIPFYVENISDSIETVSIRQILPYSPSNTIEISSDGQNWTTLGTTSTTALTFSLPVGSKIYMRANANSFSDNNITGCSKVGGNIMSLLYGSNFTGSEVTFPGNYISQFLGLFYSNNKLNDAGELILPATTLTQTCYREMFIYCDSLVTGPKIMAKTLADGSCMAMFMSCSKLNDITIYADDISANSCLQEWVDGVAATGTFRKRTSTTYPTGVSGIPTGWTVVNL